MIVEYEQDDGSSKIFGYSMPDGPLTRATGQILRAYHHKCFWTIRKREHRGDTGRILDGVPNAYQIGDLMVRKDEAEALGLTDQELRDRGTAFLADRLHELRELARAVGKGVGDATVAEAFKAQQHGGPYVHTHHLPLDLYQLTAHLVHAHGEQDEQHPVKLHALHGILHARSALDATRRERALDSGHREPVDRDWREQHVTDV